MVTFNLVVGNSYQVTNGVQSTSLEFLGMVGNGSRRALLFANPSHVGGIEYDYIGCRPEIVYPESGTSPVTITVNLRVRFVGNSQNDVRPYTGPNDSWSLFNPNDKG